MQIARWFTHRKENLFASHREAPESFGTITLPVPTYGNNVQVSEAGIFRWDTTFRVFDSAEFVKSSDFAQLLLSYQPY